MIEINLVPENLRRKKRGKKKSSGRGFALPKNIVVGMIGGFIILLLFVHVVLQFFITVKFARHQELKSEWDGMLPVKQSADVVMQGLRSTQNKIKALKEVTEGNKILWAQKLNEISDALPRGVWIKEIVLIEESLLIQGSSVSKDDKEILNAHKFASNLEDNKNFKKYFSNVEMGIHKTRKIATTSIADFSVEAVLEK